MTDITQLILDDHETFRRKFAALDDADEPEQLRAIWDPLAALLDVHAVAEEVVFYPELLRRGDDDAEDETVDAIGDHNDIRDGVREELGRRFLEFKADHAGARNLDTSDKDPQGYVSEVQESISHS